MLMSLDRQIGLSEAALLERAPAAFTKSHRMSDQYRQVRTYDIVEGLAEADYFPVDAGQDKPTRRNPAHVAHNVILRHREVIENYKDADEQCAQIVIVNSHNGRCKLRLCVGMYRFVCSNGLIIGEDIYRKEIRHTGKAVEEAQAFAQRLTADIPLLNTVYRTWSDTILSGAQQTELAHISKVIRFGEHSNFTTQDLLQPRREADVGDSLWKVFNRIQENCTKGGIETTSLNGRRTRSGDVRQVERVVDLNRDLWKAASQFVPA